VEIGGVDWALLNFSNAFILAAIPVPTLTFFATGLDDSWLMRLK
jgi:hypothetical protein